MLAFDRALISGKLISESSLAEMFRSDMGCGCGWVQFGRNSDIYYHGGETWFYKAYNMYLPTEKYGNLYLIQLHPTVAGDEDANECMKSIALAAGI